MRLDNIFHFAEKDLTETARMDVCERRAVPRTKVNIEMRLHFGRLPKSIAALSLTRLPWDRVQKMRVAIIFRLRRSRGWWSDRNDDCRRRANHLAKQPFTGGCRLFSHPHMWIVTLSRMRLSSNKVQKIRLVVLFHLTSSEMSDDGLNMAVREFAVQISLQTSTRRVHFYAPNGFPASPFMRSA